MVGVVEKKVGVESWYKAGKVSEFRPNDGVCIKYKDKQIAVYNFKSENKWFACQNLCPHKKQMVLARGMLGTQDGVPKVTCPLHKKSFSLETGECSGDDFQVEIYQVKVEGEYVFIGVDV